MDATVKSTTNVEFQDIYYTVKLRQNHFTVSGYLEILHGVSGSFNNGQLSVIVGPSGAGKSSLLNAISGLITSGVKGNIKLDRNHSCYITQEDLHLTHFSIEELMYFSCELKLKNCHRKPALVKEVLENLNLYNQRHMLAEHLSGGERKRLSIALELISNPRIFFLDEPTTGLDEVTAVHCIRLLKRLAKQGRTVVCTIHQPSPTMVSYFDSIFVLARGSCVYQGTPTGIVPFLRHVDIDFPKYHNPTDFIIELCDFNEDNVIDKLSDLTENGQLIYIPQDELAEYQGTQQGEYSKANKDNFFYSIRTLHLQERRQSAFAALMATGSNVKAFFKKASQKQNNPNKVSGVRQFYILFRMMITKMFRSRIAFLIQFLHHLLCGIVYGMLFFASGNKAERVYEQLRIVICTIMMIVYTQTMIPVLYYHSDVKMVKKHNFNRWYDLAPYFTALTISRIPLQFFLNFIFVTITYWMSGLSPELWRYGIFLAVCGATSLIAEGMGLAIGATFNETNGSLFAAMVNTIFMVFSYYGIDFAHQVPTYLKYILNISFIRPALDTIFVSMLGYDREVFECNEIYCHYKNPKLVLMALNLKESSLFNLFALLTTFIIFYRVLLFVCLRYRCRT